MRGVANDAAESTPNSRREIGLVFGAPLILSLSIRVSRSEKESGRKENGRCFPLPLAGQSMLSSSDSHSSRYEAACRVHAHAPFAASMVHEHAPYLTPCQAGCLTYGEVSRWIHAKYVALPAMIGTATIS